MIQKKLCTCLKILLILLVLAGMIPAGSDAGVRMRGSFGIQSYGYEDEYQKDHLWILQSTRFSVVHSSIPLSFYFSGGYFGDNEDDFSASGRGRLYKGYLQYGDFRTSSSLRLGRFFLYRGVGIGVVDGIDISHNINKTMKIAVYAGMMGHFSRDFEFEDPGDAFAVGGEFKWMPSKNRHVSSRTYSLSYTNQSRDGETFLNRIGLTGYTRINKAMNVLVSAQLRVDGAPLRKIISRFRYSGSKWNGMAEASIYNADVADYSWFKDFEQEFYTRIRFAVDRYLVPGKWAIGLENATLLGESETGLRITPVLTTPYGQAGYRFYSGEFGLSDGPWVNLKYSPTPCINLHAYGAMMSYEWEAFDIESEDLTMLQTGIEFTPKKFNAVTISAEYQVYQTPQYTSDRRMMGGIVYRFDSAGRSM